MNYEGIYSVNNFGILNDGKTNNTVKINELAILIGEKGGGIMYFPPGEYITGAIDLKSNTTLFICPGATILGSENGDDYPWEGDRIANYTRPRSGLVRAFKAENVTIEGGGTIDGRGYFWWDDPSKWDERPWTIQPILCNNFKLRNVNIKNSTKWAVHPLCCDNVTIDGITITNPAESPNTDGINPESCSNVHISNCHLDVGDDCITIKSGKEYEPFIKSKPCENITITNCTMLYGHGGVVIGSEMSGSVRNVTISNCVFDGTERGIRIKTRRQRGGVIEDILINNIIMKNVLAPITMNCYYKCGAPADDMEKFSPDPMPIKDDTPAVRNISASNIMCKNTLVSAMYLLGLPERPIENLNFTNISIEMKNATGFKDIPVAVHGMEEVMLRGAFLKHVKDVTFDNVRIRGQEDEAFTLLEHENVLINGKEIL